MAHETNGPSRRSGCVDDPASLRSFRGGKVRHVLNVRVFAQGIDVPELDNVVIARPTCSPVLYAQMIGRGLQVAR